MNPKVSIVVPIHDMKDGDKFLWRLVNSLTSQTFKDWELIITKDGKMAENTNAGIKRARGKYVKILYLDDVFTHEKSLHKMVEVMDGLEEFGTPKEWLICGVNTNPEPYITENIKEGNNKLGSPSALMFRNHFEDNLLFDERMSWLLDCDYYHRMNEKFGHPITTPGEFVTLGTGEHQMTHILTDDDKLSEHIYMKKKYEN